MMNKSLSSRLRAADAVKAGTYFVFLLCLLMVSCMIPGRVSAQDPTPEPVVHTIANPSGTTIDLFDYYVYGTDLEAGRYPSITYINNAGNPNNQSVNTGINDDHDLKFIQNHWSYNGDRREFQNGQIVDHPNWWNHWIGQGSNPLSPALAQGIVQTTLDSNGYPVLAVGSQESLDYLFTPSNEETTGFSPEYPIRDVYRNVNNLFYVDETGHYTYDSNWERALLDPNCQSGEDGGGCNFTVTQGQDPNNQDRDNRPQFLPLGDPFPKVGDEFTDPDKFFLGMHMQVKDFSIPENGKVLNPSGDLQNMVFKFSGDDDVWVFIDGVLVGDVGGLHLEEDLTINFVTGEVTVECHGDYNTCGEPVRTTIRQAFADAGADMSDFQPDPNDPTSLYNENTFRSGTYHTLDFFYLERGASESNMAIQYNLVSSYDFTAHKSLHLLDTDDAILQPDQFKYKLTAYDCVDKQTSVTSQLEPPMPHHPSSLQNGVTWESGTEDGNPVVICGNSSDGFVNFGSTSKGAGYDYSSYVPLKCKYSYEELPPANAHKIENTNNYEWNGQIIEPNHDGTYTFGDMAYDLTKYYFWGTIDSEGYGWISKEYHLKEDMSDDPLDINFVNYDNYYGASGRYTPEATKFVENRDDSNEERTFTYTLRYAGDPATADPVLTGTVTLHDDDTPADVDFNGGIYLTLKTLKYLSSEEGGNKAVCTKNSFGRTVCTINYVMTENDPTRTYNDIKPNTQRFNLTLTATDEGDGTISFLQTMTDANGQPVQNARAPFVNVERANAPVEIKGHKTLLGREMTAADIWIYTLSPINGGPMPAPTPGDEDPGEVTNTGRNFVFENIIFTPDHVERCDFAAHPEQCKQYHYDVTEAPDYPGIANDPVNPKRFNVTVYFDENGDVAASVTYENPDADDLEEYLTFTNIYQATGSVQPDGNKRVVDTDGDTREPRIMTFILTDPAGYVAEERRTITAHDSTDAAPDLEDFFFSTIRYSLDTDGELVINGTQTNIPGTPVPNNSKQRTWTQTYLITEQDPALTDNGLKPNHQGFRVTVTITDDGEGNLTTQKTICEYDTTSPDTTPECADKASIAFVNTERKDLQVFIPGIKLVEGHTLGPDDVWSFHIGRDPERSPNNTPLPQETTVHNDQNGDYSFGPIIFTPQQLGAQGASRTYYYLVTEEGNVPNYSNATGAKEYAITLAVITDQSNPNYGELQVLVNGTPLPFDTLSPEDPRYDEYKNTVIAPELEAFTNFHYDEGSTVLAAHKTMNIGIPWPAGTPKFEFKLTGTNDPAINMINNRMGGTGGVLTAEATQAIPTARFDAFTFTHDDYLAMEDLKTEHPEDPYAGTYQFTVEETIPAGATGNVLNGVTYSTDKYKVWISLGYDAGVTVSVYRQKVDSSGQPIGQREQITAPDGIVYNAGDFENEYNVNDVAWTPKASKDVIDVDGHERTRTFTFDLNYALGDEPTLVDSKSITINDSMNLIDLPDPLNVVFSQIIYTRDEGTLPAGTYNLTDLVGHGHAFRETAADGSLVWTIPYILTEQASGYKDIQPNTQSFNVIVHVTDNGTGQLTMTISPEETDFTSLAFINNEIANVDVPITGTKYIPQRALKEDDKWIFVIWSSNRGPLPDATAYACSQEVIDEIRTKYNQEYGGSTQSITDMRCVQNDLSVFSFGNITFEPEHLPDSGTSATYQYYVAETGIVPDVSNTTAPPVGFSVNVSTDRSGNLTAVPNPENLISALTFTNNYYGPGTVVLGARKVMTDNLWPLRTPGLTFDFTLTGENEAGREKVLSINNTGKITETASQENPIARFDDFRFTLSDYEKLRDAENEDEKYYLFRIVENKPTGDGVTTEGGVTRYKGVAYSNESYDVRVYLNLDPVTGRVTPAIRNAAGSPITPESGIYNVGTFTNTYSTNDAPVELTAKKKVTEANGTSGQSRDFTFELLYGADGTKAANDITVTVSDDGTTVNARFTGTYARESNPGTGRTSLPKLISDHRASRLEEDGKIHWIIPYILREKAYTGTDMIPNNTSYNVTVIVEDDGNGNLTATVTPADIVLEFVNQERKPVVIPVQGKKILDGRDLVSTDQWTFIITSDTDSPLPVPDPSVRVTEGCPAGAVCVRNSGAAFDDVLFGNITFTSAHLGPRGGARTHHYRVTETGTVTNVSNSEAVVDFSVTVSVDPTSGDLVAVSDPANLNALIERITFINHYYDEDQVVFGAEKVMDPWSTKVTEFNFTMTGTNDPAKSKINAMGGTEGVLTAVSRQSAPVARFMPFTFTSEDYNALHAEGYTGDQFYTFTITEVVPEGVDADNKLKGVTYSAISYDVKVTLNMEEGKIIPVVTDLDGQPIEREEGEVIYSFEFVNSYKADPVTWSPVATKRIIDADGKDKDREFTFELSYVTGEDPLLVERTAPVTAHDLGEAVDVIFSQITYTRDNPAPSGQVSLPLLVTEGHHATRFTNAQGQVVYEIPYVLTEVKSEDKAMMPNDQKFEIVVTVIDDGEGKLLLTAAPDNKAYLGFINAERNDVEIPVSGRKHLDGRSLTLNDKWTYILTAETEGAPMPVQPEPKPAGCPADAVCVQNEYRYYDFGNIVFTPQHLGDKTAENPNKVKEYTYKVTEIGSVDGVTNDTAAEKTFTVTVSVNPDNSNLMAEVSPANLIDGLTFTNVYNTSGTGEILVQKILEGREWLDGDEFTFTLSAAEETPKPALSTITIGKNDADHTKTFGQITYTKAGTYSYVVKETKGELGGVTYDETEHIITITLVDDGKGHLIAAPGDTLIKTGQFTNTYEPQPVRAEILAKKDLTGRAWKSGDEFLFMLQPVNGAPMPAGSPVIRVTDANALSFGRITFTAKGTYQYTVSEISNNIPGLVYDETAKTVTIEVTDNNEGQLVISEPQLAQIITIANTYNPSPARGSVSVRKVLEGREWKEGDTFTFTLSGANGAPMPAACAEAPEEPCTVTVTNGTAVSFGQLTFTAAGSYTYTVTEVEPETPLEGVIYDTTPKTVTITVIDDGQGNLTAPNGSQLVQSVSVTNTYNLEPAEGEIKVIKTLNGRNWKAGDEFIFLLQGTDGAPMPTGDPLIRVTSAGAVSFGKINFTKAGVYTYTVTEINNHIEGITYDVDADGAPVTEPHTVTITVVDDGNGNLIAAPDTELIQTVEIINKYTSSPDQGEILVEKKLEGRDWQTGDEFTFTLAPAMEGAPMPAACTDPDEPCTVTVTGPAAASFGQITFTEAGTFTYTVTEEQGTLSGVTYDTTPKTVTITVVIDGNGNPSAPEGGSLVQKVTVTNTYKANPAEGEILVEKTLEDRDWQTGDSFTFTLAAVGGSPMPASCIDSEDPCTVTVTGPAAASFGKITFTAAGEYSYTVTEQAGSLSGVTYDTTPKTVTINVVDDGQGNLIAPAGTQLVQTAAVTNTYAPAPAEGEIKVLKTLNGREWRAGDEFLFLLESAAGAPMPSGSPMIRVTSAGEVSFGTITFTEAGSYTYTVTEINNHIDGITYDVDESGAPVTTPHTVTITVVDNGSGQLVAGQSSALVQTVEVINKYTPSPEEGEILVEKKLEGRSWQTGDSFTFTLTAADGVPMPDTCADPDEPCTVTVTDGTAVSFGKITFTEAGDFTYTVTEEEGTLAGVTYDTTEHTVTITVVEDENGNPVAPEGGSLVQKVTITNTYEAEPAEGEILVEKTLEGRDWADGDEFTFSLTAADGAPMPASCIDSEDPCTVTVTDENAVSFGTITFTEAGEFTYTVTEEEGSLAGVTYDTTPKTVTITVIDDGQGNLIAPDGVQLVQTVSVTNTYKPEPTEGEINVLKTLNGRDWRDGDEFLFLLEGAAGAPMPSGSPMIRVTSAGEVSFGTITFTEAGEYIYTVTEINNHIDGITYDVDENGTPVTEPHTVTITVVDNGNGQLVAEQDTELIQTVEVINKYTPSPEEGEILVEKVLEGRDWQTGDEFTFTLTAVDGAPMPDTCADPDEPCTVTVTDGTAVSFGTITFTEAGDFTYTVTEEEGSLAGVTYDTTEHTVTITVAEDENGNPVAPEGGSLVQKVTVTNTYKAGPAEGEILVEKTLEGRDWEDGDEFTFTLEARNGAPIPAFCADPDEPCTVTVSDEYAVSFGTITFTAAGNFTYTVTEEEGSLAGVTYDTTPKTVTITVVDDGQGNLIAPEGTQLVQTVSVTNTYKPEPAEGEIKVLKTLNGRDWRDGDEFLFLLEGAAGAPMPSGSPMIRVTSADEVSFGSITFTEAGTYIYTITEINNHIDGITYDVDENGTPVTEPHTVTITVVDDGNGQLIAEQDTELIQTVEIINKYTPSPEEGEILVEKVLEGRGWQDGDEFTFTLTAADGAPMPESCADPDEPCTVTITDGTAVSFGTITFTEAGDFTYTVTEEEGSLGGVTYDTTEHTVTITVAEDENGNPVAPEGGSLVQKVTVTNTYKAGPAEGEILVEKTLEGRDWEDGDEFTFTLEARNGAPIPAFCADPDEPCTVTVSDEYAVSFGTITFTAAGDFTYTVTEEEGSLAGVTYDTTPKTVTITVVDDGQGNLIAPDGTQLVQTVSVTNTYKPEPTEGEIKVLKTLNGRDWRDGDKFLFLLEGAVGAPMPSGSPMIRVTSADEVSFGTITFTEAGEYTYTVTEINNHIDGITYDVDENGTPVTEPHTVTIIVVDDGNGQLVAEQDTELIQTVEVINKYTPSPEEGEILVEKVLEGRDWQTGDSFTFTLTAADGVPMPERCADPDEPCTVTVTDGTAVSFGTITFTEAGDFTYTVTEEEGSLAGVTYDTTEHTVTITVVEDENGNPVAPEGGSLVQKVTVTNTYKAGPAEGEILVEKTLEGRDWEDGDEFTFTLEALNGAPEPASTEITITKDDKSDDGYIVSFGAIEFTEPGTYVYIVCENGGTIEGMTYDETEHIVIITVVDDGNGNLTAPDGGRLIGTAEITNSWAAPVEDQILVRKDLVGRDWQNGDEFTFTLTAVDDAPMPATCAEDAAECTVTVTDGTTASFPVIRFTEEGTYVYIVRESADDPIEGLTYDTSDHYVIIIVEKNTDGELEVVSGEGLRTAVITNTYTVNPVCVQFGGCKAFPGAPEDMRLTPFTFTLIDENGEEQTATATGAGGYQFEPFLYTAPGVYRYTVREENDEVYGIEYDTNEYTVTVTVTKDEETGRLTAEMEVTDSEGNTIDSSHGLNFTNPYTASATAYISVSKQIDGADWPEGASAVFTLLDENGTQVGSVTLTAPGEVRFEGLRYEIEDVGKTFSYTVIEEPAGFGGGWSVSPISVPVTVTVTRTAEGVLEAEVSYPEGRTFVNTYNDTSIQFQGRKILDGRELGNGEFTFILEGSDGTHQVVVNNGSRFVFETIYFTEPGEYVYTIREEIGSESGMTYDETVYTITVTVTQDADGNLEITTSGADLNKIRFTNVYRREFFPFKELPKTGFSAIHPQALPEMPKDLQYKPVKMTLEIPTLSIITDIVEVPMVDGEYPVTWLGSNAGLLEGTSMPGDGRTILTGHNHLNDTSAGPFAFLSWLNEGDRIFVLEEDNNLQMYSVYANEKISSTDFEALDRISKEYENSITMITCEDEREEGGYANRRIIAARRLGL